MRAKGADVSPVDVHDAWVVWMQIRQPDHSALAPYETLDSETQDKDRPFVQAIRRVATASADPALIEHRSPNRSIRIHRSAAAKATRLGKTRH